MVISTIVPCAQGRKENWIKPLFLAVSLGVAEPVPDPLENDPDEIPQLNRQAAEMLATNITISLEDLQQFAAKVNDQTLWLLNHDTIAASTRRLDGWISTSYSEPPSRQNL
eukprot:Gregarina_sp_Poly_1__1774@NODE_145_length_12880_cov_78_207602_g130_i0_p10_GENE_NODE_145_length_12880_cov_78_207602_g130_i0NODE_145_length_12880_cov_78_207602_g130_i0_p10_ORF_typecomplete_len111_score8_52_NODE_145_length_12880_cov_78_207602_g130_i041824514